MPRRIPHRAAWLACAWLLLVLPVQAAGTSYALDYRVEVDPARGEAQVVIATRPVDGRLVRMRIQLDPARYSRVRGDGSLRREGDRWTWEPPREGGTFGYRVRIDRRRGSGGYDARITQDWALLRGDHLVPPLQATVTRGADSSARMRLVLPEGWSAETPYLRSRDGKSFVIVDPERRMDRPKGWMVLGRIGVRRDTVAGMRVAVAAPRGHDARRNDLLAFITALGPELRDAFGTLPPRLLLVVAGDPMWRGGLSGTSSLYLHADRPLISGNGSSTPAHELVHVVTRLHAAEGDDWIVEGIAEYYSIELPRRAGLTSDRRAERSLEWMRRHGDGVRRLHGDRASGPLTARAVTLFEALDKEIRQASEGQRDLDDVVRRLMPRREVSRESLRAAAKAVLGRPSRSLSTPLLE
jgi:hypothetical protein